MSNWPLWSGGGALQSSWKLTGATAYAGYSDVLVADAALAHTKGAFVEIITSAEFATDAVFLDFRPAGTGVAHLALVDIAVGPAGSEVVVIENLPLHMAWNDRGHRHIWLPLSLPRGARVSARCQSSTAGASIGLRAWLYASHGRAIRGPDHYVTLGANPADSGGTQATGAAAHTFGLYAELTSACPRPLSMGYLMVTPSVAIGNMTNRSFDVILGVGASGSEVEITPRLTFSEDTTADDYHPYVLGPLPLAVPRGARIAVKFAGSVAATTVNMDFILIAT